MNNNAKLNGYLAVVKQLCAVCRWTRARAAMPTTDGILTRSRALASRSYSADAPATWTASKISKVASTFVRPASKRQSVFLNKTVHSSFLFLFVFLFFFLFLSLSLSFSLFLSLRFANLTAPYRCSAATLQYQWIVRKKSRGRLELFVVDAVLPRLFKQKRSNVLLFGRFLIWRL